MAAESPSDVSGPVAMTQGPLGISQSSLETTSMLGFERIFSVIMRENSSRLTASAPPAGTAHLYAVSTHTDDSSAISALRSPPAEEMRSAFREFEQTSSAKPSILWAGDFFCGFISKRVTLTPRFASCKAASHPASPAPTTVAVRLFIGLFRLFSASRLFLGRPLVSAAFVVADNKSSAAFKESLSALGTKLIGGHIPGHKLAVFIVLAAVIFIAALRFSLDNRLAALGTKALCDRNDGFCGFAGSFGIKNRKFSKQLSQIKAKNIAKTNADYVITTCPACILGLKQGLFLENNKTKVISLLEFLSMADKII